MFNSFSFSTLGFFSYSFIVYVVELCNWHPARKGQMDQFVLKKKAFHIQIASGTKQKKRGKITNNAE